MFNPPHTLQVLVVDANEGPMAQTKYVLSKGTLFSLLFFPFTNTHIWTAAMKAGKRAVVVLNKVDRPNALTRISAVESELFDLFGA